MSALQRECRPCIRYACLRTELQKISLGCNETAANLNDIRIAAYLPDLAWCHHNVRKLANWAPQLPDQKDDTRVPPQRLQACKLGTSTARPSLDAQNSHPRRSPVSIRLRGVFEGVPCV